MARVLRAQDVDTTTFTQTQFREGYDEREVDDLLEDVAATLRRYESGSPAGGFRMDSTGLAAVRLATTKYRRGYDHAEVDAFLADVAHTLEHHEAGGAVPAADAGPSGPTGAVADPPEPTVVVADQAGTPVSERESWRARLVRILRGEDG
jgi:DivIVA domain-containing protein